MFKVIKVRLLSIAQSVTVIRLATFIASLGKRHATWSYA